MNSQEFEQAKMSFRVGWKKHDYYPGERFNRLVLISIVRNAIWLCRCDCGVEKEIFVSDARRGKIQSCGCRLYDRAKHKNTSHPLYNRWRGLHAETLLCSEWMDFDIFVRDVFPYYFPYAFLMRFDTLKPHSIDNSYWRRFGIIKTLRDE